MEELYHRVIALVTEYPVFLDNQRIIVKTDPVMIINHDRRFSIGRFSSTFRSWDFLLFRLTEMIRIYQKISAIQLQLQSHLEDLRVAVAVQFTNSFRIEVSYNYNFLLLYYLPESETIRIDIDSKTIETNEIVGCCSMIRKIIIDDIKHSPLFLQQHLIDEYLIDEYLIDEYLIEGQSYPDSLVSRVLTLVNNTTEILLSKTSTVK